MNHNEIKEKLKAFILNELEVAQEKSSTFEDKLQSGTYDLSVEISGMNVTMQGDVKIDRANNSVEIWRTTNSGEYSKRSAGTISFDDQYNLIVKGVEGIAETMAFESQFNDYWMN